MIFPVKVGALSTPCNQTIYSIARGVVIPARLPL